MKKNISVAIAILFKSLFVISQVSDNSGIKFEQGLSWEAIKEKAKRENKYVFMDVYASWCFPCKLMDEKVYPEDSVGKYFNDKFISVKVQMDSSKMDTEPTKSWYSDAKKIKGKYEIEAYPSFLFFSPDGQLVFKESGFKPVPEFIGIAGRALDPQNKIYYSQFEDYRKGKRYYEKMGGLWRFVKKVVADRNFAQTIAQDYKENYLDLLPQEKLLTIDVLEFVRENQRLVSTGDNLFKLFYTKSDTINKLLMYPGISQKLLTGWITNDELANKLISNGKPITKKPDWGKYQAIIADKYKFVDARAIILNYQVDFYKDLMDWRKWAEYKDKKITHYPPKRSSGPSGLGIYIDLNVNGAWFAFLYINDKKVLTRALDWIDLAIKLEDKADDNRKAAYFDTKANLLHKLGRTKEAILLEEQAVKLSPKDEEILTAFEKMKKGEPTWKENK